MTDVMLLLILLMAAIIGWFAYRLNIGAQKAKEKKAKLAEAKEKAPSEWTEEDRKLLLNDLEKDRRFLTFQQYDILKSKYQGTVSVTEMMIKNGYSMSEIGKMGAVESGKSKSSTQADATKTIVKDAVVGGVIAGPTGAVVGAIVGKSKVDNNASNNK